MTIFWGPHWLSGNADFFLSLPSDSCSRIWKGLAGIKKWLMLTLVVILVQRRLIASHAWRHWVITTRAGQDLFAFAQRFCKVGNDMASSTPSESTRALAPTVDPWVSSRATFAKSIKHVSTPFWWAWLHLKIQNSQAVSDLSSLLSGEIRSVLHSIPP